MKSACGCGAVDGGLVEIASNFAMCLKPEENQLILHAFDVLDVLVRLSFRISLFSVVDLRSNFVCPEVGLGF